jgi:hypothetical protein
LVLYFTIFLLFAKPFKSIANEFLFLERIVKRNHSLAEFGPLRPSQARVGRVVGLDCFAILENFEGLSAKFNERGHGLRVEFVQLRGFFLKNDRDFPDLGHPSGRSDGREKRVTWHAVWPSFLYIEISVIIGGA